MFAFNKLNDELNICVGIFILNVQKGILTQQNVLSPSV